MTAVLPVRLGENCYVIQVDHHKFFFLLDEGYVHGSLKSCPAFINPKGILAYMNVPQGVVKVVFPLSSGMTDIWL